MSKNEGNKGEKEQKPEIPPKPDLSSKPEIPPKPDLSSGPKMPPKPERPKFENRSYGEGPIIPESVKEAGKRARNAADNNLKKEEPEILPEPESTKFRPARKTDIQMGIHKESRPPMSAKPEVPESLKENVEKKEQFLDKLQALAKSDSLQANELGVNSQKMQSRVEIETYKTGLREALDGFDTKSKDEKEKTAAAIIPVIDRLDKSIDKYKQEMGGATMHKTPELDKLQNLTKDIKKTAPQDIADKVPKKELGEKIGRVIGGTVAAAAAAGLGAAAVVGIGVAVGVSAVALGPPGPAAIAAVGVAGLGASIVAGTAYDQKTNKENRSVPASVLKTGQSIASNTVRLLKKTGHISMDLGGKVGKKVDKIRAKRQQASKTR